MFLFRGQGNSIPFEAMLALLKFYSSDVFASEAASRQELCTDWVMIEGL